MRRLSCTALVAAAFVAAAAAQDKDPTATDRPAGQETAVTAATATSPLDFTMKDIDGKPTPLSQFKGKVLLITNVASKCGYTPQYGPLQALYEKYGDQGLVVLGFPANNFGRQEPGDDASIKEFCTSKFHVKFPMFSKVSVGGEDACELYKFLTSKDKNGEFGGPIKWNFTKFLVGRDGKVIARFETRVAPDDKQVIEAIEKALNAKP